jgi:Zn-dependent protease with chaperone function
MKYTAKLLGKNVNVSETHPLKEFAVLASGILGVLILIYLLLGFALELVVVPHMPHGLERSLGELFLANYSLKESPQREHLQGILDRMAEKLSPNELDYQVHVEDSSIVNAMALPGGQIVFFKGLLEQVESENELAMILGHELGHFANRDHLKGLGRGLVFLVLSAVVLGEQSGATRFLQGSLARVDSRFSQQQEREADEFGLHLLQGTYGHVAGATDFLERSQRKEQQGRWAYFLASHPSPAERVDHLKELIAAAQYPAGEKTPLGLGEAP